VRVPTTRAQPQFWLTTKPPPTLPPHTSASTPWPLGPSGRACTGDNDTMHPCHAHMHNEHELHSTAHTRICRYTHAPSEKCPHMYWHNIHDEQCPPWARVRELVLQLSRPHCRSAVKGPQLCPTNARCFLQLGFWARLEGQPSEPQGYNS